MPDRTPVKSSNIQAVEHDPESNVLEVEFKGGGVYSYSGVTREQYQKLLNAESVGKHFHANIKNNHKWEKQ